MAYAPRSNDYLLFELSPARFAVRAGAVREVLRAVAVSPVPNAPAVVTGVFNLRGRMVPVLDIRSRFSLAARAISPADHFVVAEASGRTVCLHVDRALGLSPLTDQDIDSAREVIAGVSHITGFARDSEGVILIHDLDTFLSRDEIVALDALDLSATQP